MVEAEEIVALLKENRISAFSQNAIRESRHILCPVSPFIESILLWMIQTQRMLSESIVLL